MSILQLDTTPPRYPVGSSFQLRRNAWSRELITATVERARLSSCGWIYTLAIDNGGKYPHWRVVFENPLNRQIVEVARAA